MTDTQERIFVTVAEVSRITGWSRNTIYRRAEEGLLPDPAPDVRPMCWHRDTWQRWLDKQRTKA